MPFFGLKNVVLHPVVHRACHRTANHNILYASCPEPQYAVLGPEFTAYLARVNKILKMVSQAVATTDDSTVYASIAAVENFPRWRWFARERLAAEGPSLSAFRRLKTGGRAWREGRRWVALVSACLHHLIDKPRFDDCVGEGIADERAAGRGIVNVVV